MKTTIAIFATALMAATASAAEIRLDDCPPAVQKTIKDNSRGGHIDEIESYSIQGKQLYVAEVELSSDRDLKIHVASDGALVKTREDSSMADAPEAVRKTVESKLGGGRADDVDKEVKGSAVTYYVEIERKGAPDLNLVVDADGKVVSEQEEIDD